jgi:hypothetical protein
MAYTDREIENFLRNSNWELGSNSYDKSSLLQNHCKAIIIGLQLQKENKALKRLIEEL